MCLLDGRVSAHDALILADVLQRPDGLKVPQGKATPSVNNVIIQTIITHFECL